LAALAIPEIARIGQRGSLPQVRLFATGCNAVVKFGDNTVAADATGNGTALVTTQTAS
jgi:hypothetical protein